MVVFLAPCTTAFSPILLEIDGTALFSPSDGAELSLRTQVPIEHHPLSLDWQTSHTCEEVLSTIDAWETTP